MIQQGRVNAGPDYADLHRHVGGSVHPKVLYGYLCCFCTDNPAFNGRYLQAEHEVALENELINFSGLVRCQRNAFKHAF